MTRDEGSTQQLGEVLTWSSHHLPVQPGAARTAHPTRRGAAPPLPRTAQQEVRPAAPGAVQVRCGQSMVGGASKPATVARIYDLCGPTYPGQLDPGSHTWVVQYPGALFLFPAPSGQAAAQEMPPELPGQAVPTANRICIFAGSAGAA